MLEEFFQQGDMERAQGLPLSPLMDRTTTALAPSQINFIEFVVAPLFLQVNRCQSPCRGPQWFPFSETLWHHTLQPRRQPSH